MNRRLTITLTITVVLAAVFFLELASAAFAAPSGAGHRYRRKLESEPTVVQRIIKIEGSVEKPRVLFIVPRSKLWRGGFLNKSFREDILMPVYPDKLIKQWARPARKGG